MSIRIRLAGEGRGQRWVALCAARSVEQPGDIYLDDAAHAALTQKFMRDFAEQGSVGFEPMIDSYERTLVEREESNNANRADWDRRFVRERESC